MPEHSGNDKIIGKNGFPIKRKLLTDLGRLDEYIAVKYIYFFFFPFF